MRVFRATLTGIITLALVGCATLPDNFDRPGSHAITATQDTRLGRLFEADRPTAESGFAIVNDGRQAFTARAGLADLAEKSIDAQYYLWNGDRSGRVLIDKLVTAARRGVRVRILIDDTDAVGRDFEITALSSLPNMEVRLFNPYAERRSWAVVRRGVDFFTDLSRLNHRMHNKIFVVDNQVAVVGGRNIGDEYFGADEKFNFRDLDLLAVGPVVPHVSAAFDEYWNSDWSYPAAALTRKTPTADDVAALLSDLRADSARQGDLHELLPENAAQATEQLTSLRDALIWAPAEVVSDPPGKIGNRNASVPSQVTARLREVVAESDDELLVESAYFVPGRNGVQSLLAMAERGMTVRILTNSLASTDASIAHTGYKRYRKQLLAGGVHLYEVQPRAQLREQYTLDPEVDHSFGLHSKAVVFDRRVVFVGTLNLDPRSINLNTEMGLLVYSDALAGQVAALMEADMRPENSWQVTLDGRRLAWAGVENGRPQRRTSEPQASFGRKLVVFFGSLIPIEKQL